MATKGVSKQSWTALLEHDQKTDPSFGRQTAYYYRYFQLVKSARLRTVASKHCLKFDAHEYISQEDG